MSSVEEISGLSFEELNARIKKAGSQRAFSRDTGIPRSTLQGLLKRAFKDNFAHRPPPQARDISVESGVRRFILTAAQDSTKVHTGFLRNLEAYRDWFIERGDPCEIMIAGFTYNKSLFEDHGVKTPYFADELLQYMVLERVRIGDKVDFCAEMNTLPTANAPLTGFETYTRHRWGIFPHAKVQLRSIPTMKHDPAKIIMTTGAVTLSNYIPKRAGLKASFHHVIGAVLVEINADGVFFARHLLAEPDGSFHDLDIRVDTAEIIEGNRVEAINHGDLHCAQADPEVAKGTFGFYPTSEKNPDGSRKWVHVNDGSTSMIDALRPRYQFFHDVFDHQARNHHNLRDPHHMFRLFHMGVDSVENEAQEAATFLEETKRPWCRSVVVESNHDLALLRWLREGDYRNDPLNAVFFLKCQTAIYEAIRQGDDDFSIFEHVLRERANLSNIVFLRGDESFMVLDIEKGLHGHHGANGARGSNAAFARMGSKSTTGHTHSPAITDGSYTAGTKSKLDMGYNHGLSSWSHSDVITLPNGKRQIVTWNAGKYRL